MHSDDQAAYDTWQAERGREEAERHLDGAQRYSERMAEELNDLHAKVDALQASKARLVELVVAEDAYRKVTVGRWNGSIAPSIRMKAYARIEEARAAVVKHGDLQQVIGPGDLVPQPASTI